MEAYHKKSTPHRVQPNNPESRTAVMPSMSGHRHGRRLPERVRPRPSAPPMSCRPIPPVPKDPATDGEFQVAAASNDHDLVAGNPVVRK